MQYKDVRAMKYNELVEERYRWDNWFYAEHQSLSDHEEGNIERSEDDMAEYNTRILEITKELRKYDSIPHNRRQAVSPFSNVPLPDTDSREQILDVIKSCSGATLRMILESTNIGAIVDEILNIMIRHETITVKRVNGTPTFFLKRNKQ